MKLKELFEKYQLTSEKEDTNLDTVLDSREIRNIISNPFYQRNYVWDNEKQTYFIDSILLGVPIPPIIFFQVSDRKKEIIDGKQRFETLKLFKENYIKLDAKIISKKFNLKQNTTFEELSEDFKNKFLDYNLTPFEFKIIGKPTEEEINKIKIEIFKRYNVGITSIKTNDIFRANNTDNDLLLYIYDKLTSDETLLNIFNDLFQISTKKNLETIETVRKRKIIYLIASSYIPLKKIKSGKFDNVEKYFEDFLKIEIAKNEDFSTEETFEEFKRVLI